MKRYLPVFTALALVVIVFCTAAFRSRLAPRPTPLPRKRQGVVLILVAHWMLSDGNGEKSSPHIAAILGRGPAGLIPTRSGAATDDDLPVATRMLLAGTRSPVKNGTTLPGVVRGVWQEVRASGSDILAAAHRVPAGSVVVATSDATALDTTIGQLTATGTGLPDGWSLVVVGATPAPQAIAHRERVAPVLIWQRGSAYPGPVVLTSPSVRNRPGFAAATDVAATVAALLDLPIDRQRIGDGRAMETVPLPAGAQGETVQYLWRQAATASLQAREQHLLPALPWCLAALLIVSVFAPWQPLQRATRAAALFAPLSIIVVALLVTTDFWTVTAPDWLVYLVSAIPTIAIALIAAENERWEDRLPRLLAAATALTIIADTLLGGPLLSRTPFSYSILEAARFYGIGNEVSGVLLGAAIVAIGADTGALPSALFGIALATVSAAPSLGADAGGFIATLIAFATLLILLRPSQTSHGQTVRIAALAGGGIVLVTCAFALWDAGRGSAQRSHIGEAIAAAQARGMTAITDIVTRKLAVNIRLLFTSPWAALFATEMGLLAWISRQKRRRTGQSSAPSAAVKAALFAAIIALFALNDSGVIAAATCGLWMFALSSDSPP